MKSFILAASTSNERLEELEDKVSRLEEERDNLEIQIETISKEKENEAERLSNENESLSEKNSNLEEKVSDLESEIEELKAELNEARDSVPDVSDQPALAAAGEDISVSTSTIILYTTNNIMLNNKIILFQTLRYVHHIRKLNEVNALLLKTTNF